MARGINKVTIVGNLGQDPDVKYSGAGNAICNVSVATSEAWKDKSTGQQQERVEWHKIVFFNKLAEIAGEYLKKGSQVYIEGSLRTRKWQEQSGADRYTTEIVANQMQMLGGKVEHPAGHERDGNSELRSQQPPPQQHSQPANAPPQGQPMGAHQQQAQGMDYFDSDIPF